MKTLKWLGWGGPNYIVVCLLSRTILFILLFVLFKGLAIGNGASYGRRGETVFPLSNGEIQMVSESIYGSLHPEESMTYSIRCVFSFLNLTNENTTVDVGFPIDLIDADSYKLEKPREASDREIIVHIDGRKTPVILRKGTVNPDLGNKLAYPVVFMFPMSFGPNEKKTVEIKYFAGLSAGDGDFIAGETLVYIVKTGALWAGNISKAKFQFELPDHSVYMDSIIHIFGKPNGYRIRNGSISWEFKDWDPKEDINIRAEIGHMDALLWVIKQYILKREYAADKKLYSEKSLMFESSVESHSPSTDILLNSLYLWVLRNEIYARHGYQFSNSCLDEFFSGFPWYVKNQNFSESLLSPLEKKNLKIIEKTEKQLKKKHYIKYHFRKALDKR